MTTAILKISNILTHLLSSHGISEAELGRKIDVPRATINRLVSGKTPDPRASTLKTIACYFDVSVDQLLGEQPLFSNANKNMATMLNKPLPIIDWLKAANWTETIQQIRPENHFDWIMVDPSSGHGAFALQVRGESMWPQFQENTILIIDPFKQPENRDFVIVNISKTDEIIFRQLIIEGSYKFLKAINSLFPSIQVGDSDKIIGVIVQTRNNYI